MKLIADCLTASSEMKSTFGIFKRKRRTAAVLLFLLMSFPSFGREIILDSIYITPESDIYKKIISAKMESYKIAEAVPVDGNVIFADWENGNRIIYVKEFKDSNVNYIYRYDSVYRKSTRLYQFQGAVTSAELSSNGKWLVIKTITFDGENTASKMVIFNTDSGKTEILPGAGYFDDLSFSPDGNSYIRHTEQGIKEITFGNNRERTLLSIRMYKKFLKTGSLVAAHVSPDHKRIAVLTGGGGSYKCLIFVNNSLNYIINDVTSISEFFWIDNYSFVFRSGYTAFYRTEIFNTLKRKSREIGSSSLNTNITFTAGTGMITFLKESLVNIYNTRNSVSFTMPIEGEDMKFAPDRNRFCIIFNSSLFVVKKSVIDSKRFFLERNSARIADIYRKALNQKNVHENEFSKQFLERKLNIYSGITGK